MGRTCALLFVALLLVVPGTQLSAQENNPENEESTDNGMPSGVGGARASAPGGVLLGSGEAVVGAVVLNPLVEALVVGWVDGDLAPVGGAGPGLGAGSSAGAAGGVDVCGEISVAPVSVEELEAVELERRLREQELLDASAYGKNGTRREGVGKPAKVAVYQPDADAVIDLWDQIREVEDDGSEPGGSPGLSGSSQGAGCAELACYSERIEDVRFGHLSGEEDGGFAQYVSLVGGFVEFANRVGSPSAELVDRDELAASITSDRLGERPRAESMPVFYYCRQGPAGDDPIELNRHGYWPSFGWSTTVGEQFDVGQARRDTMQILRTRLFGDAPVMQTIPPIETGYTFVNLPMWLWLVDPLVDAVAEAVSEQQTARLQTRARLVDVTWNVGGTEIVCTPEQMRQFDHGVDSISDTSVECVHVFTTLVDYTMAASARYVIEERVSFRGHRDFAWPQNEWVPHPDPAARIVIVTSTSAPMSVHQILSMNIPLDLTDQEIAALSHQP